MPRPVLLSLGVLAASVALLLASCSGAETQDVLTSSSTTSGMASSSGAGTSGASGTSGVGASGGTSGMGTSSGTSGTTPSNCTPEEEPNDGRDDANVLSPARCGTVGPRDRRDFLTFQLKPTTKTLALNFSGRVRLKVDIDGQRSVELTPDDARTVPFAMGKQYFIEVGPLTDTTSEIPWQVSVIEK